MGRNGAVWAGSLGEGGVGMVVIGGTRRGLRSGLKVWRKPCDGRGAIYCHVTWYVVWCGSGSFERTGTVMKHGALVLGRHERGVDFADASLRQYTRTTGGWMQERPQRILEEVQ